MYNLPALIDNVKGRISKEIRSAGERHDFVPRERAEESKARSVGAIQAPILLGANNEYLSVLVFKVSPVRRATEHMFKRKALRLCRSQDVALLNPS